MYNLGVGYVFYLIIFIIGAALGSFVNVVALRYGSGLSFARGSSICFACGKKLRWHELLPIISYIKQKGRCSACRSKFSIQYLLVEILSGLAFVWLFFEFGFSFNFLLLSTIYYLLTIIFIYDLRHKIIPDFLVFLFILFSFFYSYFFIHNSLFIILTSSILIPLPFALIWLFSRGRLMGLGDAKLMVGMGLLLGLERGISAVFLSFWLGAAFIFILYTYKLFCKKFFRASYNIPYDLNWKSELPFAPFLILGTILTFIFEINLFYFS